MIDYIDLIQWPAMVITIVATWYVSSKRENSRHVGFWLFLLGNILWLIWAIPHSAWALIFLQVALAIMNIRGVEKTE